MADTPKIKNPLIHSHDQDHDHHHDDVSLDMLDPAQQSLSDALHASFMVLKGIMILLLAAYCFTGVFRVDAREVAVRLRFGEIIGDQENQVYTQGWYAGLPYPIEQKIYVPMTPRSIAINDTFWFDLKPGDVGKSLDEIAPPRGGLNPEIDGSLLTGDANIIHGQFTINYIIRDAVAYVQNVGNLELADQLVRVAAEEGIVYTVAQTDADPLIKGQFNKETATDAIQDVLDKLGTGIKITDVLKPNPTMPLAVRPAYNEVTNAESERAQKTNTARRKQTTTLNAAAGEAHEALFKLIQAYELAHSSGDHTTADALSDAIDEAFDRLQVNGLPLGGEAARILSEAKSYKTQTVEQVKSEANSFNSLIEQYRQNPNLVRSRLWQRAREQIFSGKVETFYADGQIYITTNRDPDLRKKRELQKRDDEQTN